MPFELFDWERTYKNNLKLNISTTYCQNVRVLQAVTTDMRCRVAGTYDAVDVEQTGMSSKIARIMIVIIIAQLIIIIIKK